MTPPSPAVPGVAPDTFRRLLGRFASGVTVVTALDGQGRPHGMTVSAFSSVSMTPPLVLVCIDRAATMLPMLDPGASFAINILATGQEEVSRRFADEAMELRFDGVPWDGTRAPWIGGAHASLSAIVTQRVPAGDHDVILGEVIDGRTADGTSPLVYHQGRYGTLR